MFKQQDNIFITYSHPSEQKKRTNRRAVSSFVSRSYRPTSKKIVFEKSNFRPFVHRSDDNPLPTPPATPSSGSKASDGSASGDEIALAPKPRCPTAKPLCDRPLGSPFSDPFVTYPIPARQYLPFFINYCEPSAHSSAPAKTLMST